MKRRWRVMFVLVVVLAMATLTGCARQQSAAPQAAPTQTPEPTSAPEPPTMRQVRIYLVRGEKIGVLGREVEDSSDIETVAKGAVEKLLQAMTSGEDVDGLRSAIPGGTKLIGLRVSDGGVATVGLSDEFASGGGSLSMQLRTAQVVYTLTQLDGIRRVAFELNGEPVDSIGGEGVIVDPPVDRSAFENVTPAILVESPVPGQQLISPFEAYGTSNVFEATHRLELIDASGRPIAATRVTASSGTGTRGSWKKSFSFTADTQGPGELRAFTLSPKDGSETDVVEIPVTLSN